MKYKIYQLTGYTPEAYIGIINDSHTGAGTLLKVYKDLLHKNVIKNPKTVNLAEKDNDVILIIETSNMLELAHLPKSHPELFI